MGDVVGTLQRQMMLERAAMDLDLTIVELGSDARQLILQLTELEGSNATDIEMLVRDYIAADTVPTDEQVTRAVRALEALPDAELLHSSALARQLGLPASEENLMQSVVPRGYRALSRVPRVQKFLMDHIVSAFGELPAIVNATPEELASADHVSGLWARHIAEGLRRIS